MAQRLNQLLTQGGNIMNFAAEINNILTIPDGFPQDVIDENFHVMFDTIHQINTNLREIQREHNRGLRMQQRAQRQLNNRPIIVLHLFTFQTPIFM
jgi:hypothetical protein